MNGHTKELLVLQAIRYTQDARIAEDEKLLNFLQAKVTEMQPAFDAMSGIPNPENLIKDLVLYISYALEDVAEETTPPSCGTRYFLNKTLGRLSKESSKK